MVERIVKLSVKYVIIVAVITIATIVLSTASSRVAAPLITDQSVQSALDTHRGVIDSVTGGEQIAVANAANPIRSIVLWAIIAIAVIYLAFSVYKDVKSILKERL